MFVVAFLKNRPPEGTVGPFPGLHGVSGEGDGGEPGDVADQADEEGEGRDEEVDEGQQHEADELEVGPQHHGPVVHSRPDRNWDLGLVFYCGGKFQTLLES